MPVFRHENQNYATVQEVRDETVVAKRNDQIKVEELQHREFDWWIGATTADDGQYVIDQASETANGRWVSSTGLKTLTGSFAMPELKNGQTAIEKITALGVDKGAVYAGTLASLNVFPEGVKVNISSDIIQPDILEVQITNLTDDVIPAIAKVDVHIVEIPVIP